MSKSINQRVFGPVYIIVRDPATGVSMQIAVDAAGESVSDILQDIEKRTPFRTRGRNTVSRRRFKRR